MITPQGPGVTCEGKVEESQRPGWSLLSRYLLCTHSRSQRRVPNGCRGNTKLYSGFGCLSLEGKAEFRKKQICTLFPSPGLFHYLK